MGRRCILLLTGAGLAGCAVVVPVDNQLLINALVSSPLKTVLLKCFNEIEAGVEYPVSATFEIGADGVPKNVVIEQSENECLARETQTAIEGSLFDTQALPLDGQRVALKLNYTLGKGWRDMGDMFSDSYVEW